MNFDLSKRLEYRLCFFFQAEDGIRDSSVTGVQTCALPISPEHPFPAGTEDCYAALTWAAASAPDLSADAGRVVVAGDSAGGNLAAVVALMAKDRSEERRVGGECGAGAEGGGGREGRRSGRG